MNLYYNLNYFLRTEMLDEEYPMFIEIFDSQKYIFNQDIYLNLFMFDFNKREWVCDNKPVNSEIKGFLEYLNNNSCERIQYHTKEMIHLNRISSQMYKYIMTLGMNEFNNLFFFEQTPFNLLNAKYSLLIREDFKSFLYQNKLKLEDLSQEFDNMIRPFVYSHLIDSDDLKFSFWIMLLLMKKHSEK